MFSEDRLLILDADGTTIDAFDAIRRTFRAHNMDLGDLVRFQKRRHLFKYLGGLKEFPGNLKRQVGKRRRARLIATLTEVYREEASLYPDTASWINALIVAPHLRVGLVTRNITNEPVDTLSRLLMRHGVDLEGLDFLHHVPIKKGKSSAFHDIRLRFAVNPALAYVCGDEKKDYVAARANGMHPFIVSYGFEDFQRLVDHIGVPAPLISQSPDELHARVNHTIRVNVPFAAMASGM